MPLHRKQAGPIIEDEGGFQPFFIDGAAGRLFAIYHPPMAGARHAGDVIYIPPFAEEMNRCRRMAALQARALAAAGTGVLLLDLYGCGDSEGDFAAARWSIWLDDIAAAAAWLEHRGSDRIGLWGPRLGALLALQAAARQPGRFTRLILWQPVTSGDAMLTQFLRIRVAASAFSGGGAKETTRQLKDRLAAGHSVEVAGYELAPAMAEALTAVRLAPLGRQCASPVHWLEISPEPGRAASPAARRIIDDWRAAGVAVDDTVVMGEPFWSLQEVTLAPALIDATRALFEKSSDEIPRDPVSLPL